MPDVRENRSSTTENQPTMLETQLDSISLQLNHMRAKVRRASMLEHLTETERAHLDVALARAESKLKELSETIRAQTPA